ncbi:MAG: hypothetical protein HDR38_08115 [Treponema sp.]|nr:hypothetical protein [Bacteroides sp.]MBD5427492.1 hypothetical protein [Treponema sp.]
MRHIHYKDDFKLHIILRDHRGVPIGAPDYDFRLILRTTGSREFVACRHGDTLTNLAFDRNGDLILLADNHGLMPGELRLEFISYIEDSELSDSKRRVVTVDKPGIVLTECRNDPPRWLEVELILPLIKGDPFTFDDLTDEQRRELAQEGIKAAEQVRDELNERINGSARVLSDLTNTLKEHGRTLETHTEDLVGLQEAIANLRQEESNITDVAPKLLLADLDTLGADGSFMLALEKVIRNPVCRFRVFLSDDVEYPMGFLDLLVDKGGITQVLTTHRLLDADGRISESSETDTDIHVWFRTLPPMSRTWSEWRPLKTEPDIEALSEEDIDEIFESLK